MPYQADVVRGDGDTRHLKFDTILGYGYRLYATGDLVTWSPVDPPFYGFGGEYSVNVLTVPEPGSPPPNPVPAPPSFQPVLEEFINGKTLVSFTGESSQPFQVLLDASFSDLWITGSYYDEVSERQFTWLRMNGSQYFPAYESLTLAALPQVEQDKVTAFIDAHDDIVAAGAAQSGGIAEPPPPGSARYWRVQREEIDTDGDGLMDWVEFGLGLSPFNNDSDFDSHGDGREVTGGSNPLDGTSIPDPIISVRVAEKFLWVTSSLSSTEDIFCEWTDLNGDGIEDPEEVTCTVVNFDSEGVAEGELQLNGEIDWDFPRETVENYTQEDFEGWAQGIVGQGKFQFSSTSIPEEPHDERWDISDTVAAWAFEGDDQTWISASHQRVWLEADHSDHQGVSATWFVVHETIDNTDVNAVPVTEDVGILTLVVEENDTESTTHTFEGSPGLGDHFTVSGGVATLHPEIEAGVNRTISLFPLKFEKLWEKNNSVNFVYNSVEKNDPPAIPKSVLYLPASQSSEYEAMLEISIPPSIQNKVLWAIYRDGDKLTEGVPSVEEPTLMSFNHPGDISDPSDGWAVKIGLDASGNGSLESSETFDLKVGPDLEPLKIHGISSLKLLLSKAVVDVGELYGVLAPFASALADIFYNNDPSAPHPDYQPNSSTFVDFNCFTSEWADWLTHNAGANYDDEGDTQIAFHEWDSDGDWVAHFIEGDPAVRNPMNDFYEQNRSTMESTMASDPVGTIRMFPSPTTWYDIPLDEIFFERDDGLISQFVDDNHFAIARARVVSWKVQFQIKKTSESDYDLLTTTFGGAFEDLYDFNYIAPAPANFAAALQLGYGNGSLVPDRDKGVIFLARYNFFRVWSGPLSY